MYKSTKLMIISALMIALVTVFTILIRIPIPGTQGYIHIGDVMIYSSSILLGNPAAFLVGGIGSAIADLLYFPHYALPTFIVKGIMGLITAWILYRAKVIPSLGRIIIAMVAGGAWMCIGYFIYETIVYGLAYGLAGIGFNILQAFGGAVLTLPFIRILLKLKDTL
ncbi:MAG: ECF transporter S component [Mahellales bacterium]